MKRVLVTGGSGFVGQKVIQKLTVRGFEVHVLGRTPLRNSTAIFHPVDLFDNKALRRAVEAIRADYLLHLAWYTEHGKYWSSPLNLDWIASTLNLVRLFHKGGGTRAVFAGSCAEYSWGPERLSEASPCSPTTLYGASKDALRRVLEAYSAEHRLSIAWGRLFFVYGDGENAGRLVRDAFTTLLANRRFKTSAGHHRRDFIHVADAADVFASLIDGSISGPINIGSGVAVPIRTIVDEIGTLTGRSDLIDFGAYAPVTAEPPIIEADITYLRANMNDLIQKDIKTGLCETYEYYVRNKFPI